MAEKIDKIYSEMDEQVKKQYGAEYLAAFRNSVVGNNQPSIGLC